jgi:peptidoglycan/LPS O-acetylase OafA/YrhL
MRAVAISLVLVNHGGIWFANYPVVIVSATLSGYFGVELFFVLSGFLIGSILLRWLTDQNSTTTLADFWRRRWLRTLPNYFLFLIINAAVWLWLNHAEAPFWRYALFIQNISSPPPVFFGESWSLAIEEWFYVLIPILFVTALRISPKSFQSTSLLIVCSVIVVVTIARSIYVVAVEPMWLGGVREIVIYRLDACMFGVLAAWLKHFRRAWWERPAGGLFAAGLAMLLTVALLAVILPSDSLFLHSAGFPLTSIAAALLLPTLDRWIVSRASWHHLILNVSLWSYSLYFINVLVFAMLFRWFRDTGPVCCAAAFVLLSLSIAAVVYRFYEKPIMDLRKSSLTRNPLWARPT